MATRQKEQRKKAIVMMAVYLLAAGTCLWARTATVSAAEKVSDFAVEVDYSRSIGTLRPLHAVNAGPRDVGRHIRDMVSLHKEAGFPSVRLHDCNWPHPDVVDVPTIFPLFHLDADDPKNYQFAKTDAYIKPIIENGASILYRLGVSIEHKKPRFHVSPPDDFEKWARICVNILRHYNDGWADGFHYNIKHVEIWNEFESPLMWSGTMEQYCELYRTAVTAIKKYDPEIRVAGPVTSSPEAAVVRPFLEFCRDNKVPLDFFTWHSYSDNSVEPLLKRIEYARNLLDEYGFTETESWCTEWKFILSGWPKLGFRKEAPRHTVREAFAQNRNHEAAALTASALLQMQDAPIDRAYYYCADGSPWGMFDVYGEPGQVYFGIKAFNQFLQSPNRVAVTGVPKEEGLTVAAGLAEDGKQAMIMATNFRSNIKRVRVDLKNLPFKGRANVTSWRVDKEHEFNPEQAAEVDPKKPVIFLDLPPGTVMLVQLKPDQE